MPTISEFFGIIIRMYYDEHNPPHFHAYYAEHEAMISIESLTVFKRITTKASQSLGSRMSVQSQGSINRCLAFGL